LRPSRLLRLLTAAFLLVVSLAFAAEETVVKVSVDGNQKIEEATIIGNVKTLAGSNLSAETVREDIKALFKLGYFSDIKVRKEAAAGGVAVVFEVKEKPQVKDVKISGNNEIETEKLREGIKIKARSIFDREAVKASAEKMKAMYAEKGYYTAKVEYEITELEANEVSVEFKIDEKEKVMVREIRFVGNEAFSDDEIKKQMETKEAHLFSWLTSTGIFKEEEIERDSGRISALYLNNGYIQLKLDKPFVTISEDKRWIYITFNIEEGKQFYIGKLDIKGDLIYEKDELGKSVESKEGEVFNRTKVSEDIYRLTDQYGNLGYAFANVNPITTIDEEKRTVDLTFDIQKGRIAYISRVLITGNTKTRDKVIRRLLKVREGQLFNNVAMKASKNNVYATGFFEDVNFSTSPGDKEDELTLEIKVKEGQTGSLSAGFGFSSIDKFIGTAQASLGNFMGYGQKVSLSMEAGQSRQIYSLSYFDPYFLDSDWSFGMDLYRSEQVSTDNTRSSIGGVPRLGYLLTDNMRVFVDYKFEDVKITNIYGSNAKIYQGGKTSSVALTVVRDTKDHPFDPTAGTRNSITSEYAGGPLQGDNDFTKFDGTSTYYKKLFWKVIWMVNGRAGYGMGAGGARLPFSNRYFLGGINTVRGYMYQSISPMERIIISSTDAYAPARSVTMGGNKMVMGSTELLFPIIEEAGIKGVLFGDAGNSYSEEELIDFGRLKPGVGAGIRWFTPLAPFRFEWGFPLPDTKPVFEFSIGTFF
jgi:outer membrane protein insertion porin family